MKNSFLHQELAKVERDLVEAALVKHNWNRRATAAYLGVSYRTVFYLIEKHALLSPIEQSRILANAQRFGVASLTTSSHA